MFFRFLTLLSSPPDRHLVATHMREDLDIFSFALDAGGNGQINALLGHAPA